MRAIRITHAIQLVQRGLNAAQSQALPFLRLRARMQWLTIASTRRPPTTPRRIGRVNRFRGGGFHRNSPSDSVTRRRWRPTRCTSSFARQSFSRRNPTIISTRLCAHRVSSAARVNNGCLAHEHEHEHEHQREHEHEHAHRGRQTSLGARGILATGGPRRQNPPAFVDLDAVGRVGAPLTRGSIRGGALQCVRESQAHVPRGLQTARTRRHRSLLHIISANPEG